MKQKLLIVDDRPENLLVLESTLEDPNLEFVKANSGEEALKMLLRNDISLILLDVQMPGMDGFETAELIRGNPNTKSIPIIFVSAISKEQKHIFKGYASGAIDYLFKPFDPNIMKSKVHVLLELDKQRRIVENQNQELVSAKRNTDSILQNVKEGIFLLDKDFKISPQYSSQLKNILEEEKLSDCNLLDFLEQKIPGKVHKDCEQYLSLCFDSSVDHLSLKDLNPLSQVEFKSDPKHKEIKHLSFTSDRIYNEDKIEWLIFTVNDNTKNILLEKKLAQMEEEANKQTDLLLHILHVDPKLLKDFIDSFEREIKSSDEKIKKLINAKNKSEVLDEIYRCLHKIKGNAAILDLKTFMNEAHSAEEIIINLKKKKDPSKQEIKLLSDKLERIKTLRADINQLISKLSHIYKYFRPKRTYEIELLFQAVKNLIENLQESTGKKVELIYNNFDGISIPYNCRLDLKDIFVQFTRNSFYHGIETVQERKKLNKDPVGKLIVETFKNDFGIGFTFRDDGRGLQLDKIKSAALKSGKWKKEEIKSWKNDQIMNLIFMPGITTVGEANNVAGRGIGMDIIKKMIDNLGGQITINSELNKFCEFKVLFPQQNKQKN